MYFALFSAVMLIILWMVQTFFFEDFYKSIKQGRAKTALSTMASYMTENNGDYSAAAYDVASYYDVCILILDENLAPKAIADVLPNCTLHGGYYTVDYARAGQLAIENGGYYEVLIPFEYEQSSIGLNMEAPGTWFSLRGTARMYDSAIYIQTVQTPSGQTNYLLLNSILTPVDDTVQTLTVQLLYITGIMLVLSLLLALFFSRTISRPIVNIGKRATRLARGDFDVRFDEQSGSREIDELSATLNHAASELSQVERLRTELIANISHDLRTPLTMITGYAELMRDLPGENTPENLDIIIEESKRLSTLVNDVMSISVAGAVDKPLSLSTFSITQKITAIIGRLERFTMQDGYTICFEPDEDISVTADETKIDQVLYNLITNAMNYTGDDKTVTVRQLRKEGHVKIEVTDTGPGINEQDLPHIFERYYRSGKPHKRPTVGSGLGLSIVKSALDAHDTTYGVLTKLGAGSTFWFTLGIAKQD